MPVKLTDKVVALLTSLTNEQIAAMCPAERERLEHAALAVAVRCAPDGTSIKREGPAKNALDSGVLARLARGERPQ